MKKTKIICTLGPQSCTKEIIQELINNGMDCARLNCSHGSPEEKLEKINIIRDISDSVSILLDTKGPEIRTGDIQSIYGDPKSGEGEIYLNDGDQIILTTQDIIGTKEKIS